MGDKVNFAYLLYFDGPEGPLTDRIMKRAETSGRVEDNAFTLGKRFKRFNSEELKVIEKYKEMGLVKTIDAL